MNPLFCVALSSAVEEVEPDAVYPLPIKGVLVNAPLRLDRADDQFVGRLKRNAVDDLAHPGPDLLVDYFEGVLHFCHNSLRSHLSISALTRKRPRSMAKHLRSVNMPRLKSMSASCCLMKIVCASIEDLMIASFCRSVRVWMTW